MQSESVAHVSQALHSDIDFKDQADCYRDLRMLKHKKLINY